MPGWGDHEWGPDPWGGSAVLSPVTPSGLILAWSLPEAVTISPPTCHRATRFDAIDLFPAFYGIEDADPNAGGTGDFRRLCDVINDFIFGSEAMTGVADDIASFPCILEPNKAPARFLDALLQHLGFNLDVPLNEAEKRKVIPLLVPLYKEKGSEKGIENALRLLLGIPVEIISLTDEQFRGLECGEPFSRTLTDITSASTYVRVDHPERFVVGKNIVVTDVTAPQVEFVDTPITAIASDRIYFAPQTLTQTIEAGAQIYCDRYHDQIEAADGTPGGHSEIGVDMSPGTEDPGAWSFYVDVERTVTTMTDIVDGDSEVEVSDAEFIVKGSRVRITDITNPLEPVIVVTVTGKTDNVISFNAVSLTETIEAGAEAINIFNAEQTGLINDIVKFGKPAHTHHALTRDWGEGEAVVG